MSISPSRYGMSGGGGSSSDRSDRLPQLRPASEGRRATGGDSPSHSFRRSATFDNSSSPDYSSSGAHALDISSDPNPFTLPREDVFVMREREKAMKAAERDRLNKMKIWEKPARAGGLSMSMGAAMPGGMSQTQQVGNSSYADRVAERQKYLSATLNTAHALAARALHPGVGPSATAASAGASPSSASGAPGSASGPLVESRLFQGRRREKENMSDFIAKKRDMFLIQMSLDTKRAEIQKLEEKATMKEEALRKSELMLEEDAMRFDAFLKENDRKAHDALKRADLETKEKAEKVLEIKKLNAEISKVENEMSKYEEQLMACMKYKEFLDSLTPQEHWDKIRKRKEERQKAKQARLGTSGGTATGANTKRSHTGDEKENLSDRASSSTSARGSPAPSTPLPASLAHLTLNDDSDDEEEDEMYFDRPEQLLDIFAQLEERNLFLIQNVQETEEALDELNAKFEETKRSMEEKSNLLHQSIADLKNKIRIENEKAASLKRRARINSGAGNQQKLLAGLSEKVASVYAACGFDPDTQPDTLDMLRDMEQWLETLLNTIQYMDKDKVEQAEKKKNAERRNQIRAQKKEEQQRAYEERLAKSTARANAEVVKRVGKMIMFRSPPIRKKKKKQDVVQRDEEAEELKRFFT